MLKFGVLPIGTLSPILGKYITNSLKNLKKIDGMRYQVTSMGTMIESDNVDKIFEASKVVTNAIFEMGVTRVEAILKIDERQDKNHSLEDKLKSIEKFA